MNGRISAHIVRAVALGSVLLMMTSCLRETPGHCAFAEGDATCEEAFSGTFCIFQGPVFLDFAREEYRNVSEAQRLGCYESRPMTSEGEDMGVNRKFFGCVHDGLEQGEDLLGDLERLKRPKGEGTYDLPAFLDDHGITQEEHELGCRPEPGSTTTDTSDSSSTITGSESSTTDGMSSESSTTGPMRCMVNEDCTDAAAPFCELVTGTCVACDEMEDPDAACASLYPTAPLCAGKVCVQCTPGNQAVCDAQRWGCDGATNTCVPCTAHDQCSSGACELKQDGLCFPSDAVRLEVDGDGGADFANITLALDAVVGSHGVIVVHDLNAGGLYGPAIINDGKTIALLAAPGESPIIQGPAVSNPALRISGGGTIVYIEGLSVSYSPVGVGMLVDLEACAWVDRSRIVQNAGGGILVQNDAELTLRSSFVGGSVDDRNVVEVIGATAKVLYSTLGGGTANASALTCTNPIGVEIRNSILVTRGGLPPDEVACAANITYSVTEGAVAGEGNVAAGMFPTSSPGDWFAGYSMGDFHLQNDGLNVFANVGLWQTGDPTIDIDGDPRPIQDATADFAGADLIP